MGPVSCFLLSRDDREDYTQCWENVIIPKMKKRQLELDTCLCYNPKIKSLEEANKALYSCLIVPLWYGNKMCSAVYYTAADTQKSEELQHHHLMFFHSFVMGVVQKTSSGYMRQCDFGEEDCSSVTPEDRGGGSEISLGPNTWNEYMLIKPLSSRLSS